MSRPKVRPSPWGPSDPRTRYMIQDINQVDIERLAQRSLSYFKAHAEEVVYLAQDPERRDKAIEAYNNLPTTGKFSPEALVPFGGSVDPEKYLDWVDAELASHELPRVGARSRQAAARPTSARGGRNPDRPRR